MRKYETLLLLSPELSTDARTPILEAFRNVIEREGGKLVAEDIWGMRDLAYPVKKHMRGFYVRYEYMSDNMGLVAEFERNIRITDGVYKFITVQLDDKVEEVA